MRIFLFFPIFSSFILLLSCGGKSGSNGSIENREEFIQKHSLSDSMLPKNFNDPKWKTMSAAYRYFVEDVNTKQGKKCMLVVASKKDNAFTTALCINKYLTLGRNGEGVYSRRIVIPYEKMSVEEYNVNNDMTEFNDMLKDIPFLKNFSWKNEDQNRMMSTLIMYAHLRTISNPDESRVVDDQKMNKEEKVQRILTGKGAIFTVRNFLRFNKESDLCADIERIGFRKPQTDNGACNVRNIFKKEEFNFNDKSCLFIYYPFVSYDITKDGAGEERLNCWPAVNILTYKMWFTNDGFPQFDRSNLYVSLFDKNIKTFVKN